MAFFQMFGIQRTESDRMTNQGKTGHVLRERLLKKAEFDE
jgi:hypothetical protein